MNSLNNKIIRRKLQFAGNSSYVLTLPKNWIVNVGLDNQDSEVIIEELPDKTIRIRPSNLISNVKLDNEYTIWVNDKNTEDEIIRLILASYLASKSKINIRTKDNQIIPTRIVLAINEITQKLWGSEIIEDTANQIIIHDALDPSQLKITEIIQKSWFTASNMIDRAFDALFTKDGNAALIVTNSEKTLDKLYYLALRQLYHASSHMIFASEIGIEPSDIIDYHLLMKNIERMGDHAEQLVAHIDKEFVNIKQLKEAARITKETCDDAINAFLKKDGEKAEIAASKRKEIFELVNNINATSNEFPLVKSILRIADYASDIGELVINRIIAETNKIENYN